MAVDKKELYNKLYLERIMGSYFEIFLSIAIGFKLLR